MNGWLILAVAVLVWFGIAFLISMWAGACIRLARIEEVGIITRELFSEGEYKDATVYFLDKTKNI